MSLIKSMDTLYRKTHIHIHRSIAYDLRRCWDTPPTSPPTDPKEYQEKNWRKTKSWVHVDATKRPFLYLTFQLTHF